MVSKKSDGILHILSSMSSERHKSTMLLAFPRRFQTFLHFTAIELNDLGQFMSCHRISAEKKVNMNSKWKKMNGIRSDGSCSEIVIITLSLMQFPIFPLLPSSCPSYSFKQNSNVSIHLSSIHDRFLLYVFWMMFSSHVFCVTMKMVKLTESVMHNHSTMDTQMLLKCLPDLKIESD